jgi:hypothetical protein
VSNAVINDADEIEVPLPQLIMTAFGSSNHNKNINVVPPSLSRFRAFNQSRP